MTSKVEYLFDQAIQKRRPFIRAPYDTAFRLFNGFLEGVPDIMVDVFATTVVFHDYTDTNDLVSELRPVIKRYLPWVTSGVVKKRRSKWPKEQAGKVIFGDDCATEIVENGVRYALRLTMNQDASFYLDTRGVRLWLKENMRGKRVLNTFAYTGSMGVAALKGGASEVIQLDLSRQFLSVAMKSAKLNGFEIVDGHYQTADFWSRINQYKKTNKMFDCVILDPPVFSRTPKGTIDVVESYHKIINKVRPLIVDGGCLITINNALFQSGEEHQAAIQALCEGGYVTIESTIPVPDDCAPDTDGIDSELPADPAPYNGSTKITILRIKKK